MLLLQVFLLFASTKVFSLTCDTGRSSSFDGSLVGIKFDDSAANCSALDTSCGMINQTFTYNGGGAYSSYSEEVAKFGCANSTMCTLYAGGSNQCSKVSYSYYEWYPTGRCNNGTASGVNVTTDYVNYYACCQTDKCTANFNYSTCVTTSTYQNYVSAINTCWNQEYQVYVNDMYCKHDHLYNYSQSCTTNGTWNGNTDSASVDSSCYYQATCSSDLIAILQNLGDCACTATNTYDYNITTLQDELSSYYSEWCPNIAVTCSGNTAVLQVTYYYIKWSFKLDVAYSDVNGTVQANIKSDVCTHAKVDSSTVSLEYSSSNRRNLLSSSSTTVTATITTEDSASATTVQSNVNSAPTTIGGYTVSSSTSASSTSTSQYGNTTNTTSSSDAKMLSSGMMLVMVVMFGGLLN